MTQDVIPEPQYARPRPAGRRRAARSRERSPRRGFVPVRRRSGSARRASVTRVARRRRRGRFGARSRPPRSCRHSVRVHGTQPARSPPRRCAARRPTPRCRHEHRALVVPEVPQQPPQPLGAAHASVRDDEHVLADPRPGRDVGEAVRGGQRVPPFAGARAVGQILVDVEERRARDVALEVDPAAVRRVGELPPAVDELVAQRRESTGASARPNAAATAAGRERGGSRPPSTTSTSAGPARNRTRARSP